MTQITDAQHQALRWLKERNGSGVIDKGGKIVAAGERSKFMADTWLRLMTAGLIESDGYLRVRVRESSDFA